MMSDLDPTKPGLSRSLSRRAALRGAAAIAAGAVMSPAVLRAQGGGKVFVRTSGGSYQDALKAGTWDAFSSKTGIEVVPVPANTAKLLAMAQTNASEVDLVDANASTVLTLEEAGLLDSIDPSRFKDTNPKDLSIVTPHYVAYSAFAESLVYNTEVFAKRHPKTWAEFWDVKTFPGRRTLQDAKAISPDLEFALLADGVPMDKLYPLDIDRAFKKMKEIKPSIIKFYDTGALGASLLADKTAVLGSLWTNRVEVLRQGGAPVAVEWNQAMRSSELTAVFRNAPNKDNAYRLLDYSMSPEAQAKTLPKIGLSPSNARAFDLIDAKVAATLPTAPANKSLGFDQDAAWWLKNREKVAQRWEEFVLG
jgi:putative spermidine/putrescine transport system substrate-binding protein